VGLLIAILFFCLAIPQLINMTSDFALTCGLCKRRCKKNTKEHVEEDLRDVQDDPVRVYREPPVNEVQGSVQMEMIDEVDIRTYSIQQL
jgi:hypothetical protein